MRRSPPRWFSGGMYIAITPREHFSRLVAEWENVMEWITVRGTVAANGHVGITASLGERHRILCEAAEQEALAGILAGLRL